MCQTVLYCFSLKSSTAVLLQILVYMQGKHYQVYVCRTGRQVEQYKAFISSFCWLTFYFPFDVFETILKPYGFDP